MMNILKYSRLIQISNTQSLVTYIQGQSPKSRIREYFYFINHQGMLFLDDARMKNFTSCFKDFLSYGYGEDSLMVSFEPNKLFMNIQTGKVYHPGPITANGIGLVRSKLGIELSSYFEFDNGENQAPTHFNWNGTRHSLEEQWYRDKLHLLKNNTEI
ncbi:hypothetical protein KQX54_010584 [Cotesia glomerata]|uniref:Uncharacterized protein n=1 Tax=Cotesia glomerata TaxID=32391 RepID=A0AAV7INL3_COTGL|nr:hypothetical protein KQX54_010584 [Cotesia glomerata]